MKRRPAFTVVQKEEVMSKVNKNVMNGHQFTLILTGIKELTPDVTDALFEAGFDDALVGTASGVSHIDVYRRKAESLEMAVRGAIRDVERVGLHVDRVESEMANSVLWTC